MADRQLFQLVTKVPLLSDVMGIQDTIGAVEQGKLTVQALKDIILLNLPVRIAKILVIRFTEGTPFTHAIMESDYPGVNVVSIIAGSTSVGEQLTIKMSANIFDALKTDFFCNSVVSGTPIAPSSIPYVVIPSVIASDQISLVARRADGDTTLGSPNWTNYFLTMLIYP